MSEFSKEADWLPYTNALYQVLFWKDDLLKIQKSLSIMDMMDVPESDPGYRLTQQEIQTSKQGLKIAQFKLKRALNRLTESDKENFKDKLGL